MTDSMHELEHGRLHRFRDWLITTVPKIPGAYTIWHDARFLYVGIAKSGGLSKRLGSHATGRRSGDKFNVYVSDRLVLRTLTPQQIAQIADGTLRLDALNREYIRDHLSFRFCPCTDAREIERMIRAGRWPYGQKPALNPT